MYTPELEATLREMGNDYRERKARRTSWQRSGTLLVGGGGTPVTMQADFGEADTYTVAFIQPYQSIGAGIDIAVRAEALIQWNIEGTYKSVRVSLVGGMSVTAVAQAVKVTMTDATPQDKANDNPYALFGHAYNVSCQIGHGTRGSTTISPYYIPLAAASPIVVADGQSGNLNIPVDAGVNSVLVCPLATDVNGNPLAATPVTAGQTVVSMYVNSLESIVRTTGILATYDPITKDAWVPMIPGCTAISLINQRGDGKHVSFSVFLGVDG